MVAAVARQSLAHGLAEIPAGGAGAGRREATASPADSAQRPAGGAACPRSAGLARGSGKDEPDRRFHSLTPPQSGN